MWGLLIANHLDQSLWSTNQKYWAVVRSNLLHSFLEVQNCVAPFTSHDKLHEFGAEKPISWAKPAHFDLFRINCTVRSHILSSVGDALMAQSSFRLVHTLYFPNVPTVRPNKLNIEQFINALQRLRFLHYKASSRHSPLGSPGPRTLNISGFL
jgi:hypothetical protein